MWTGVRGHKLIACAVKENRGMGLTKCKKRGRRDEKEDEYE